jgi:hypothetical protein
MFSQVIASALLLILSVSAQGIKRCGPGVGVCPAGFCCKMTPGAAGGICGSTPGFCNKVECDPQFGACAVGRTTTVTSTVFVTPSPVTTTTDTTITNTVTTSVPVTVTASTTVTVAGSTVTSTSTSTVVDIQTTTDFFGVVSTTATTTSTVTDTVFVTPPPVTTTCTIDVQPTV